MSMAYDDDSGVVVLGGEHAYGIGSDGQFQYGEGPLTGGDSLVAIQAGTQQYKIEMSSDEANPFLCGIQSGGGSATQLTCWGDASFGQIPNAPVSGQVSPKVVIDDTCTSFALGAFHTCAVCGGGTLSCFGDNTYGQLGTGDDVETVGVAQVPPPPSLSWLEVAAGSASTCALDSAGGIWCWGDGEHGELANGGGAAAYPTERWVAIPTD
jgi:alpha-tubulin suppressor-like RCC1 family protein